MDTPSPSISTNARASWLIGLNASLREEWYFLQAHPGSTAHLPSEELACTITTDESRYPEGAGPWAAQCTEAIRFSVASEEPLSGDLCDPVRTILPGGLPPWPAHPYDMAAEDMCRVSVPWVMTQPTAPSAKASSVAFSILFQCLGLRSSDHMFPSLTARILAIFRSSGTASSNSCGSNLAVTAPVA